MSTIKTDPAIAQALHDASMRLLLIRVQDGTATAADLNVARQFLKDQGIQALPAQGSPTGNLAKALPTFEDPLPRH